MVAPDFNLSPLFTVKGSSQPKQTESIACKVSSIFSTMPSTNNFYPASNFIKSPFSNKQTSRLFYSLISNFLFLGSK